MVAVTQILKQRAIPELHRWIYPGYLLKQSLALLSGVYFSARRVGHSPNNHEPNHFPEQIQYRS